MKTPLILASCLLVSCSATPRSFLADMDPPEAADLLGFPSGQADLAVPAVSISSIVPGRASTVGRDLLTITGTGFDSSTQFSFGGIVAEVVSITDTTAKVYAPGNPGGWGVPVPVTARRARDGQAASNSNAAGSASAFRYYASTLAFSQLSGRINPQNFNNARVPLLGDFNNDGIPDLIATWISNGNYNTYLNSGGGGFVNVRNDNTSPSNLGTQKGTVVDLDGDGNQDMLIADESGTWQYNLGNGSGSMVSRGQNFYQVCSGQNAPTPIRLSNNMYPDVAIVCINNNQVRIWNTQYSGGNQGSIFGGTNNGASVILNTPASPQHLMVTDLNKDGKQDLVVLASGNNVATLTWYLSQGTTLPSGGSGTAGTNNNNQNPYWGRCGDLNGDTFPDCVVADLSTNTVRTFLNDGAGNLLAPKATGGTVPVGQEPREVNLVDINGDGFLDLLVASRQLSNFQIIPGRGDGTFGNIVAADGRLLVGASTIGTASCRFGWSIQTADFDADGRLDAVASCEQNDRGETQFGGFYIFKNISR